MKRISKLLIVVILSISILCSCKSRKEYKLTEITSEEFVNTLKEPDSTFVVAIINFDKKAGLDYYNDLEDLTKNNQVNINYLDYRYISSAAALYLDINYEIPVTQNSYLIIQNSRLSYNGVYSDKQELYSRIYPLITTDIKTVSDEKKKENLSLGVMKYQEGNMSEAMNYISSAITLKETKKFAEGALNLKIFGRWDSLVPVSKKKYNSIFFRDSENRYYETQATSKELEDNSLEYDYKTNNYFRIKDGIIYTSKDNKKYKETYSIKEISSNKLVLKNSKTKKLVIYKKKDW